MSFCGLTFNFECRLVLMVHLKFRKGWIIKKNTKSLYCISKSNKKCHYRANLSLLLLLGRQFIAKTTKHRRNDNLERKTLQIFLELLNFSYFKKVQCCRKFRTFYVNIIQNTNNWHVFNVKINFRYQEVCSMIQWNFL